MNFGTAVQDYPKGTVVSCPKCKRKHANLKNSIKKGQFFTIIKFDWLIPPYAFGDDQICRFCFQTGKVVPLFKNGSIARLSDKEG